MLMVGSEEVSRNFAQVITANKDAQNERRSDGVYVKDLEIRASTVLRRILPVLSLEHACEDYGYSYDWTSGQKPHLVGKYGRNITCNTENHVPIQERYSRQLDLHHGT